MSDTNPPPWRSRPAQRPPSSSAKPPSTIPAKRSVESQEAAWIADEDRFVLEQAKKKAAIRVKSGRARPIDWLAVTLRLVEPPAKKSADEDEEEDELDVMDPEGVLEDLNEAQLTELGRDIDTYLTLETNKANVEYWTAMKTICKNRQQSATSQRANARGAQSVSTDVERLLGPKTLSQLEILERQIQQKLRSNEPIDVDYWESLLSSLTVFKAKARLRNISQAIVGNRLQKLRSQQEEDAQSVQKKFSAIIGTTNSGSPQIEASKYDPEPFLKIRSEDKSLEMVDEKDFLTTLDIERRKVLKLGYIPPKHGSGTDVVVPRSKSAVMAPPDATTRFATSQAPDLSRAATALYEREVSRGVGEDEEIFAGEEEVTTAKKSQWDTKYRPRKPRYFNRVQMGYEWNKYNQTHYDHDNPPPKVVQGYKFNIFYPDLIDKTRSPTYRIERENGRKRGESHAPAGEEDTCIIRFIAGPPYEDIAFRIVDKEWDYSSRSDRGFKSRYEDGILNLHFQFKKIFYRK